MNAVAFTLSKGRSRASRTTVKGRFSIMKWLLFLALALSACSNAPNAASISKVVISRTSCDPVRSFAQYALYRDGRVSYNNGLRYSVDTRAPLQAYRDVVGWLVKTPAFGPRWDYLEEPDKQPSTTIWIEYGGRHTQVRFPTQDGGFAFGGATSQLNRWTAFAVTEARGAVVREREKVAKRLRRFDLLQRVVIRSNGCFGTCPAYTAIFDRDGTARMQNVHNLGAVSPVQGGSAAGHVPFSRVISLLRASNFSHLEPEYQLRVQDVYGVGFEFDYRDGFSYTVDAPDRTQWTADVAELVGAFNQLINDNTWRTSVAQRF